MVKSVENGLDLFVRGAAMLVFGIGALVLVGWIYDIPLLKQLSPAFVTMKPNTALGLCAVAVGSLLLNARAADALSVRAVRSIALLVFALGALTAAQEILGIDIGIDQIFIRGQNRMSPATAISFVFLGLALASLKSSKTLLAAHAHWFLLPPFYISGVAVLGYVYGVTSLYGVAPFSSIALHTAISLFVVCLALSSLDRRHGLASLLVSDTAGGILARRLLPAIPLLLFILGWIRLAGQRSGFYGFEFGLALMVVTSITVCVLAVGLTAVKLRAVDIARRCVEDELASINASLERRVHDRTQQLEHARAQLVAANKNLEKLSLIDGLTGIANRRSFDSQLETQIALATRTGRPVALILCDVDFFKFYNDLYGHQAGDQCLTLIATALKSCCRRPGDIAARYGGEEFALILPDTDLQGAAVIAELARIAIMKLEIPHEASSTSPIVTISMGVSISNPELENPLNSLVSTADNHLYKAKHLGRNQVACGYAAFSESATTPVVQAA